MRSYDIRAVKDSVSFARWGKTIVGLIWFRFRSLTSNTFQSGNSVKDVAISPAPQPVLDLPAFDQSKAGLNSSVRGVNRWPQSNPRKFLSRKRLRGRNSIGEAVRRPSLRLSFRSLPAHLNKPSRT